MEVVGFPSCGDVTIFIERERGCVDFTFGPFKRGVYVSHKFFVTEIKEVDGINGVKIVDVVHLLNRKPSIEFGWRCTLCSCVETAKCVMRQCKSPSIGGYISQTLSSMENLYHLCELSEGTCGYSEKKGEHLFDENVSYRLEYDMTARTPLLS